MSSGIKWYTVEEATTKYALETSLVLKWAELGSVRAEHADTRSMRVNGDDLEHKVHEIAGA